MAGIFGDKINSRADFFEQLELARAECAALRERLPRELLLPAVQRQLDAIAEWTADGRVPDPRDRKRIRMGYQMYREYEMTEDQGIYDLHQRIIGVGNYVKSWPDDATAADERNAEYVPYDG